MAVPRWQEQQSRPGDNVPVRCIASQHAERSNVFLQGCTLHVLLPERQAGGVTCPVIYTELQATVAVSPCPCAQSPASGRSSSTSVQSASISARLSPEARCRPQWYSVCSTFRWTSRIQGKAAERASATCAVGGARSDPHCACPVHDAPRNVRSYGHRPCPQLRFPSSAPTETWGGVVAAWLSYASCRWQHRPSTVGVASSSLQLAP